MALEDATYVPTLAVRASEMNGLEYLPVATKDRITPCFLLAPWANSNSLDRTITRIEKAFSKRNYFLDLDRDYQPTNSSSFAQQEFLRLLDPSNCYEDWATFVERHDKVWPCVQHFGSTEGSIKVQIERFQQAGRSYCLRLCKDRFPANIDEVVGAFAAAGTADFVVILEGGWTNDVLSLTLWFETALRHLQNIDANVPVVISCTSMPRMFDTFNGRTPKTVAFANRVLIDQIARKSNRARIIYGDWGSTRPREQSGIASRPLPRIDYPNDASWSIARNKDDEWDFSDAALAVVKSADWNGALDIWGEQMISYTAVNKDLGIDTPQKNVAARVNIHLHRQAFFGEPLPSRLEEDWED